MTGDILKDRFPPRDRWADLRDESRSSSLRDETNDSHLVPFTMEHGANFNEGGAAAGGESTDSLNGRLLQLHTSSADPSSGSKDGFVHTSQDDASRAHGDGIARSSIAVSTLTRSERDPASTVVISDSDNDDEPQAGASATESWAAQDWHHVAPVVGADQIQDQSMSGNANMGMLMFLVPVVAPVAFPSCEHPHENSMSGIPNTVSATASSIGNHKPGGSATSKGRNSCGQNTRRNGNGKRKHAGTPTASGGTAASKRAPAEEPEEVKHERWEIKRSDFIRDYKQKEDYKIVYEHKRRKTFGDVERAIGKPAPSTPDATDMTIHKRPWEDMTQLWRSNNRLFAAVIRLQELGPKGFSADQAYAVYIAYGKKEDDAANHIRQMGTQGWGLAASWM